MTTAEQEIAPIATGRRLGTHWTHLVLFVAVALAALVTGLGGIGGTAPADPLLPLSGWLSIVLDWFSGSFRGLFRIMSALLAWPIEQFREGLHWLPWPTLLVIAAAIGYLAGGTRLALFCGATFAYIVIAGLWEPTAVTLALIAVAVPFSAALALALGIASYRWPVMWRVLQPVLDLMQTIPTLAYLLPILVLFGIGPMVAVVASLIYAIPPMVRAVVHGLHRVPQDIVESGQMSGSNRNQLLAWVLVPSAMPTILLGLNQTIMAGLSMVVIASMVGGVSDIGIEVFQTMKQAKFGRSIMAGLVIALLAMAMDRVTRGFAERSRHGFLACDISKTALIGFAGAIAASLAAAMVFADLRNYSESWVVRPAPLLDAALEWFTINAYPVTSAIKTYMTYFVLLPLKSGLHSAMRPNIWGIEMSPAFTFVYIVAAAGGCLALAFAARQRVLAIGLGVLAIYYYLGTVGTPWTFTVVVVTLVGWFAGGWRVALVALGGMLFILFSGNWERAMISLELTAVGVALSVLLGSGIGIWAALNDRVSAIVRPICDTLQTMPIFVFLIPAVMVFLVGEFTALFAIMLYAIVPPIRYGELGIRSVPHDLIEAARMMGVKRRQMIWQVQLPLALPEIALGINQTVMMALAMVVIASLVGAPGLGQDVLIALSQGKSGHGLVAGLCIAALAIVFDRIIQAWSAGRKRALGLN